MQIKRSKLYRLKNSKDDELSFLDKKKKQEIARMAEARIKEKAICTAAGLIGVFISLYGQTPYSPIGGLVITIVALLMGLWIV